MSDGKTLQNGSGDARSEAARLMGRTTSERKAASSRRNGQLAGGRPLSRLTDIPCNCGRSDTDMAHSSTCPRGRTIRRRQQKGQPLT